VDMTVNDLFVNGGGARDFGSERDGSELSPFFVSSFFELYVK
jgi:hypothetical protein